MRKLLVCFLAIVMLCTLCACGSAGTSEPQPTFKVACTDGTTRELTIAEMYEMYEKDNAQALVTDDTIISGTGTVVSPWVRETAWAYYNKSKPVIFEANIELDNGITVHFNYDSRGTSSRPDFLDFSTKEKVAFKGKISYFPGSDKLTITSLHGSYLYADKGDDAYIPVWSIE